MKKSALLLFNIMAWFGFAQAQIRFIEDQNLDNISSDKVIFIDMFTTWCSPCKWMEIKVFTDSSVSNYFNKNFISIRYDAERGFGKIVNKRYNVTSYPTFIFLKPNKEPLLIQSGSFPVKDFLELAKTAISESASKKTIHDWELDYQKNRSDTALLKKYISKRIGLKMSTASYLDHYLSLLSAKDIERFENQVLLFYSNIEFDSKWYHYLLLKQKNYVSFRDVRIIDEFDPKVKLLSILDESAGSVTVSNVNQFVNKARNSIVKMNGNNFDYLLEYLPIKIKAYNQVERVPETLAAIKEFETLLFKLNPEIMAFENKKKEDLFLRYYRDKGQLDSLQQNKQFRARLKIISNAFNFKLENSLRRIKGNHFVENFGKINSILKRSEEQLNKLISEKL